MIACATSVSPLMCMIQTLNKGRYRGQSYLIPFVSGHCVVMLCCLRAVKWRIHQNSLFTPIFVMLWRCLTLFDLAVISGSEKWKGHTFKNFFQEHSSGLTPLRAGFDFPKWVDLQLSVEFKVSHSSALSHSCLGVLFDLYLKPLLLSSFQKIKIFLYNNLANCFFSRH